MIALFDTFMMSAIKVPSSLWVSQEILSSTWPDGTKYESSKTYTITGNFYRDMNVKIIHSRLRSVPILYMFEAMRSIRPDSDLVKDHPNLFKEEWQNGNCTGLESRSLGI